MLSIPEQRTFGADAQLHAITGKPLEQGSGALHPDAQAVGHFGQMNFELAALKNKQREAADKFASEAANLATAQVAHYALAANDISGRQNSLHKLAAQDLAVSDAKRHRAALAAEHEALAVRVAEVGARLREEGIFDRHGMAAANLWFGMIRDKGWSVPQ